MFKIQMSTWIDFSSMDFDRKQLWAVATCILYRINQTVNESTLLKPNWTADRFQKHKPSREPQIFSNSKAKPRDNETEKNPRLLITDCSSFFTRFQSNLNRFYALLYTQNVYMWRHLPPLQEISKGSTVKAYIQGLCWTACRECRP